MLRRNESHLPTEVRLNFDEVSLRIDSEYQGTLQCRDKCFPTLYLMPS